MERVLVIVCILSVACCGCKSGSEGGAEGGVVNKVLTDFGLKQKPEGYTTEADKIFGRLNDVGVAEMKRLNLAEQHGVVKFQSDGELKGKYYKEVKTYESFYPTDVQPTSRSADVNDRGYSAHIEYAYRIFQSPRKGSSAEAQAETADIPTDTIGRETFRYSFGASGEWNGGKGEKTRK